MYDFQTHTHGKWILAGEHAVLRGHAALVFPLLGKTLRLRYQAKKTPLTLHYEGAAGKTSQDLFWRLLDYVKEMLGDKAPDGTLTNFRGQLELISDIPIGCGLGASAALCLAVARWLSFQSQYVSSDSASITSLAQTLENFFHGKSSGLDIVGVAAENGHYFQKGSMTSLQQRWRPCWYLSYSGEQSMTSVCIERVKALWQKDRVQAETIDHAMEKSVRDAQTALEDESPNALQRLSGAIEAAATCFQQWGLVSDALQRHMHVLRSAGALAVKPTGSGGGGYVLSLWPTKAVFDQAQKKWSSAELFPEKCAQFIAL